MAVVNETVKSGFREENFPGVGEDATEGHWTATTDAQTGRTTYTSHSDDADARFKFGPGDDQPHGKPHDPTAPLKSGSTIEVWTDENGKRWARIRRIV